jgi:hypothetical protein
VPHPLHTPHISLPQERAGGAGAKSNLPQQLWPWTPRNQKYLFDITKFVNFAMPKLDLMVTFTFFFLSCIVGMHVSSLKLDEKQSDILKT